MMCLDSPIMYIGVSYGWVYAALTSQLRNNASRNFDSINDGKSVNDPISEKLCELQCFIILVVAHRLLQFPQLKYYQFTSITHVFDQAWTI